MLNFLPSPTAADGISDSIHEWLGLAWYRLHGRIEFVADPPLVEGRSSSDVRQQVLDHPVGDILVSQHSVIIFTSAEPHEVQQLLRHLTVALTHVNLSVLYETPRPAVPIKAYARRSPKPILASGLIRSASSWWATKTRAAGIELLDRLLRWLHAAPEYLNAKAARVDELKYYAENIGVRFFLTEDSRSQASKEYVRCIMPDLGVVYGARTCDMDLFAIPRRGSITLDLDDLGDHRDRSSSGLSEAKDERTEKTISVRRVLAGGHAGDVLGERTLSIQEYDTQESIGVKTRLLGVECLVNVIRSESRGRPGAPPEGSSGAECQEDQRHQGLRAAELVRRTRRRFRPEYGRPLIKLLARFLFYPRVWLMNRRRASSQSFPSSYSSAISSPTAPSSWACSTDQFLRQVRFLKKHYKIASLPDAIEMLRERESPRPDGGSDIRRRLPRQSPRVACRDRF